MVTLSAIHDHLESWGSATLRGDGATEIIGLGSIDSARPGEITYLSDQTMRGFLAGTEASAVIVADRDADACPTNALVVKDARLAFAFVSRLFETRPEALPGMHPNAVVHPTARVDPSACIGPGAVVEAGATIGARVALAANAFVGEGAVIGDDTTVKASAVIHHGVTIGQRCMIHACAVIGDDGFGFTQDEEDHWQGIAQVGAVRVGDDVRIGAGTAIDRGAINDTVIGNGVKIDNQCQIGHNVIIGDHTLICGKTGIVGSSEVGSHCLLAGGVGIGGNHRVKLCDHVYVTARTSVTQSIDEPGLYSGGVLRHSTNAHWKRNALRFYELNDMAKRIARLERALSGAAGEPGSGTKIGGETGRKSAQEPT